VRQVQRAAARSRRHAQPAYASPDVAEAGEIYFAPPPLAGERRQEKRLRTVAKGTRPVRGVNQQRRQVVEGAPFRPLHTEKAAR